MTQAPSSALPEILARRLIQEQELQQVIVHELMRRKLLEKSSPDSHKFVLDRRHNSHKDAPDTSFVAHKNSIFSGIIGKGVAHPIDFERGAAQNSCATISNAKASSSRRTQQNIKSHSHDKIRRDRLQDMLLSEQSISSTSVSIDKKTISPRKERENLQTMIAPRKHVLKLNLGALMTSSAIEHQTTSPRSDRGSFTERHTGDSTRFVIAFSSARNAKIERSSADPDLKPSIFQKMAESDTKTLESSETNFRSHTHSAGFNSLSQQNQCLNASLGACPSDIGSSDKHSQRPKLVPEIPRHLGSSAPPGFIHKVQSLRSILANPVLTHLPNSPEHPITHMCPRTQIADSHPVPKGDVHDWNFLISKYDSRILKPTIKT